MSTFKKFLIVGSLWGLLGVVLPRDADGIPTLSGYNYALGTIIALVFLFRATKGHRSEIRGITNPILAAGLVSVVGAIVRSVHGSITGAEFPFPSPADALTLLTYPLLIRAILKVVKERVGRVNSDLVIDAVVAGAAAAVIQWTLLIGPLTASNQISQNGKVLQYIYALMGVGLLMVATTLLVAGGHRSLSNRLLASALILTFFMDNLGTTMTLLGRSETIVLYIAPFIYVLAGSGMLHSSIDLITSRPTGPQALRGISNKRIAVLAITLLAPPALVLGFLLSGKERSVIVAAAGSLMLAPLVLVRMGRLVRERERFAEQESTLRSVSEALVVAQRAEDVIEAVTNGTAALLKKHLLTVEFRTEAALSDNERALDGRSLGQVVAEAAEALNLRAGMIIEMDSEVNRAAGLVVVDQSCKGVLLVSTDTPLDEHSSKGIADLCREAAIAFRAVEQTERDVKKRAEARFESLIHNSSDIVALLNMNRELVYVSTVAERLLGYPLSEMTLSALSRQIGADSSVPGKSGTVLDLIHPDDRSDTEAWLDSIGAGRHNPIELRIQHFSGEYSWFEFVGTDMSHDPNISGVVLNIRDVNDRKAAEARVQQSEARFKALVHNSSDLVVVVEPDLTITYSSPSVSRIVDMPQEKILGSDFGRVFRDHDLSNELLLGTGSEPSAELIEFRFQGADERTHIAETSITDLRHEPAIGGFVLNARDVTERRAMEQKLLYQANHDELTGLANRNHALQELSSILSKNAGSTTVALVLLDIDDMKDVNDSLGHEVGDQLLIELSDRIRSNLMYGDIAARIAGDEFVVIVERAHGENQIMDLAEDLLDEITAPFTIRGREISISVSAGISFDHDRHNTADLMLRNADTAMHKGKESGPSEIRVFEPHMHTATFDRLELRADLARAIAHNQFEAFYQPIVNIETSRIVGAEALVRWRHPQRGMVGPNLFIPLAEETGMISSIGEWMITQASADVSRWLNEFGTAMDGFTISVNLSPQQLRNAELVSTVERLLRDAGLPPDRLVLEITESTLITESGGAVEMMQALRQKGIKLSIDDFGTGYSSLGYIQQFAFDVLKIDKSFVDDITKDTNHRIVKTIMDLARNLDVKTIAEGIEEPEQIEALRQLKCPLGQGYVFSRPVPESDFRQLLERQILTPCAGS